MWIVNTNIESSYVLKIENEFIKNYFTEEEENVICLLC